MVRDSPGAGISEGEMSVDVERDQRQKVEGKVNPLQEER